MKKLEALFQTTNDEQQRIEHFTEYQSLMDKQDKRQERKHERKKDLYNYTVFNRFGEAKIASVSTPSITKRLQTKDELDDYLCHEYADIHELIIGDALIEILHNLKEEQKEVLYYVIVMERSSTEIALMLGKSDRNIRKLYKKAIENIRGQILPVIAMKERWYQESNDLRKVIEDLHIGNTIEEKAYYQRHDTKDELYYGEMTKKYPPGTLVEIKIVV